MKLNDLTKNVPGVSGVFGKVKSLIDNFTGPGNADAAEEALRKETNPEKSRVLEVQLCLSKLQDLQVMQASLYNELKQQLDGVLKSMTAIEEAAKVQTLATAALAETTTAPTTATVQSPPETPAVQTAPITEIPPVAPTIETPTTTETTTETKEN